jgi:hypothetical protein
MAIVKTSDPRVAAGGHNLGPAYVPPATPTPEPAPWSYHEVLWGVERRPGCFDLEDPIAHAGRIQHAFPMGRDSMAVCGFRPRLRRDFDGAQRPLLAAAHQALNPRCAPCARRVRGPVMASPPDGGFVHPSPGPQPGPWMAQQGPLPPPPAWGPPPPDWMPPPAMAVGPPPSWGPPPPDWMWPPQVADEPGRPADPPWPANDLPARPANGTSTVSSMGPDGNGHPAPSVPVRGGDGSASSGPGVRGVMVRLRQVTR